jgi:osmotically-inducible protein OsmY
MNIIRRVYPFVLAIMLTFLLGCAATSTRESTGEFFDDSAITAKVKAEILKEHSLKSTEISVNTFKGSVQLDGALSNQTEINTAVKIANSVNGVKNVHNNLRVRMQ